MINQTKYIKDLLKRFGVENAKILGTPMSKSIKFNKDENYKLINYKLAHFFI